MIVSCRGFHCIYVYMHCMCVYIYIYINKMLQCLVRLLTLSWPPRTSTHCDCKCNCDLYAVFPYMASRSVLGLMPKPQAYHFSSADPEQQLMKGGMPAVSAQVAVQPCKPLWKQSPHVRLYRNCKSQLISAGRRGKTRTDGETKKKQTRAVLLQQTKVKAVSAISSMCMAA